jgi:hypothetical protein
MRCCRHRERLGSNNDDDDDDGGQTRPTRHWLRTG